MLTDHLFSVTAWSISLVMLFICMIVLFGEKRSINRLFAYLCLITAIWVSSQGLFSYVENEQIANLLIRIQYYIGAIIVVGFLFFYRNYPDQRQTNKHFYTYSILLLTIFGYLFFFSDLIISNVYKIGGIQNWAWEFGFMHYVFEALFIIFWIISLNGLYQKSKLLINQPASQLKYIFIALLIGITPPVLANILLPSFGVYEYNWIGALLSAIWVPVVLYTVARHKLFNSRIMLIQFVMCSLWIVIFTKIISKSNDELYTEITLLLVTAVFGIQLIRSAMHEREQQDVIENMANELHKSYKKINDLCDTIEIMSLTRREK